MSNIITSLISKTVLTVAFLVLAVFVAPAFARADGYEVNFGTYGTYDYYGDTYGTYDYYGDTYGTYDYYGDTYGTYDYYGDAYGTYDYYGDTYGTYDYYGDYTDYPYTTYGTYDYYGDYVDYPYTDYSYTDYPYTDYPYTDYSYGYDTPVYYNQPYYDYPRDYVIYDDYDYSYVYWDSYDYHYDYDYDRNPPRRDYDEPRCDLRLSDDTPDEGDYVTLSWTITDADHATLTGFGSVSARSGSERIRVYDDRTFRLSVEGRGGSDDCVVHVEVDEDRDPPERDLWCELDASDKSIEEGDSTTLEWDTRGDVRDARINQGIGSVDEDGGTERVRPNRTTTYRLTIEDRDGDEEECDVTVRVDEDDSLPPPPDVPLVYLSQLPYTGAGDNMTYWMLLITGSGVAGYMLFFRALPFALARVKAVKSETVGVQAPVGDGEPAPTNVTRQDVRAFVSALVEGDASSAHEFARVGGEVLFAETAVVLDDVMRARENGAPVDPMVSNLTSGWSGEKFAKLIEAFADAKDADGAVDEALKA